MKNGYKIIAAFSAAVLLTGFSGCGTVANNSSSVVADTKPPIVLETTPSGGDDGSDATTDPFASVGTSDASTEAAESETTTGAGYVAGVDEPGGNHATPVEQQPGGGNGNGNGGGTGTGTGTSGKKITLSYYSANITVGETKGYPVVSETLTEVWESSDKSVATVDKAGNITGVGEGSCIITVYNADDPSQKAEVKVAVKKGADSPTYIGGILIANKSYSLPSSYNPGGLTSETQSAFNQLQADASAAGLNIWLSSGFRSYSYQAQIYNNYVAYNGQAKADTFSARPGYSEHQTGLAIDVNTIDDTFAGTPEAIWLEQNCYKYGFIIRYPKGKQSITGYKYEPWHIRYIGKDYAEKFHNAALAVGDPYYTLEEYLNIDSYYH